MAKRQARQGRYDQHFHMMGVNEQAWDWLNHDQKDALRAAYCMAVALSPHLEIDGAAELDQATVELSRNLNEAIGSYLVAGDDQTAQALLLRVWGYQASLSPAAQARFRPVFDQPPVQRLRQRMA
jgi:hypothetical protein